MKILHIINDLSNNGGAQRFLVDLVVKHKPYYKIKILVLNQDNDFEALLKENGVNFFYWPSLSLKEKWHILRWPDLIHSHLFPSIYIALLAIGKKRVQTEHNTTNRRRDYPALKFMEYLMYQRHEKTICITNKVKEELIRFLPRYKERYDVIYNGVDLNRFSRKAKLYKSSRLGSPINIGMAGRLHGYKDHPTLLRAIARLPEHYHLHLAGDGDKKQELQTLAAQLNCDHRVHWHGVISDVPTFLSNLDVYVQSSIIEGFGLAAVEAMAEGLPVLGSDVPGLDEVIGNDSYLFELGNTQELADKIELICNNQSHYEMATRYFVERCKSFTLEQFRDSYYKTYDELYASK
ncbi:glycosyltransferase [Vibrio sp. YIC-376]|uniref:glycosyltransferase n=1 Tax=Vibrio sp. YIC-376 TaxID=3136162 RepID=UPI00402B0331